MRGMTRFGNALRVDANGRHLLVLLGARRLDVRIEPLLSGGCERHPLRNLCTGPRWTADHVAIAAMRPLRDLRHRQGTMNELVRSRSATSSTDLPAPQPDELPDLLPLAEPRTHVVEPGRDLAGRPGKHLNTHRPCR